jgi:hypothetical protein
LSNFEPYVDVEKAAAFLSTTPRNLLQKVREGRLRGHALDPNRERKDWKFKLSELDADIQDPVHSAPGHSCRKERKEKK